MSLTTNNQQLQTILDTVNALPDAGGSAAPETCTLDYINDSLNGGTPTVWYESADGPAVSNYLSNLIVKTPSYIVVSAPGITNLFQDSTTGYVYDSDTMRSYGTIGDASGAMHILKIIGTGTVGIWGWGCCFAAGTQVMCDLEGNTKPIETFVEGDNIVSYNVMTGNNYIARVHRLIVNNYTTDIAKVTLENRTSIEMNAHHPLYCEDGWHSITCHNGYPELRVGDVVKVIDGWSEVVSIDRRTTDPITTYNLDVRDVGENQDDDTDDSYYANGIVVHNAPCR